MSSIYVSIPCVEDSEYNKTIEDIFSNADNPKNVFVGSAHSIPFKNKNMISQIERGIKKYKENVRLKYLNKYRSVSVGIGRKESMSMYKDEDYVLQLDSHTLLLPSWDSYLLEYYHEAKDFSKSDKTILSCYLPPYQYLSNNIREKVGTGMPMYPFFGGSEVYGGDWGWGEWDSTYDLIPKWSTPVDSDFYSFIKDKYVFARKLNANFMFSEPQLAKDYNKIISWDFLFFEEEFIMSIEAHHLGYSFVHPNINLPIAHLYSDYFNEYYSRPSPITTTPDTLQKVKKTIEEYFNNEYNKTKIENYCRYAGLTYPDMKSVSLTYLPEG